MFKPTTLQTHSHNVCKFIILIARKSYVVRALQDNMQKSGCKKVTCKNICSLNQYETNWTEGEQPPFCLYHAKRLPYITSVTWH